MTPDMHRRWFLGAVGAAVATAGCGGEVDTQVDSVPITLSNQSGRQLAVTVDFRERGGSEALVGTTVRVDPGTEESVYAKPIQEGVEYVLSVVVSEQETTRALTGGGLRSVSVSIFSATNVEIDRVDM